MPCPSLRRDERQFQPAAPDSTANAGPASRTTSSTIIMMTRAAMASLSVSVEMTMPISMIVPCGCFGSEMTARDCMTRPWAFNRST